MNATSEVEILRSIVRGERDLEALTTLGARLNVTADGLQLDEPADAPVYEPSIRDVALGLICHWAVGTTLQAWARVLLATGMIDLSCVEDHVDGDALLGALWDAAEGSDIDEHQLGIARRLAATS